MGTHYRCWLYIFHNARSHGLYKTHFNILKRFQEKRWSISTSGRKSGAWSLMFGVNCGFGAKSCIYKLTSSAVLRRQQLVIRCLGFGGYSDHNINTDQKTMQGVGFSSGASLEADAENVLRAITPTLDPNRHKGQAGKIAVIGGCREYTGAPYFAAISALKIGADLSHVFCTRDAASVIKSYSPELIVHPILEESYSVRDEDKSFILEKVLGEVDKWMERFDCLVIGPGLGRDPFLLDCVSNIIKHARQSNVPLVIDGDGLFLITNSLDLVSGYHLAVLTPNVNEYKRLVQTVLSCEVNDEDAREQLLSLAKRIGGVTILRKGKADLISDGETVESVSIYGSPRRCGGQGDILSGSVAVFLSWARQTIRDENLSISSRNPTMLGCIAGSTLMRKAASLAFETKKRSTLTTDIIECLGRRIFVQFPDAVDLQLIEWRVLTFRETLNFTHFCRPE